MAKDKVILAGIYPSIEKGFSSPANVKTFRNAIERYIDRNIEKLSTLGPIHRTIFSEHDMRVIYDIIKMEPQDIKAIIKESDYIEKSWELANHPFYVSMAMVIRYFKIKKNVDMEKLSVMYLTLALYPSIHYKFFEFEPNEAIMNYTINNLSNKYKIKKTGVLYHALMETSKGGHDNQITNLLKCLDRDVTNYLNDIKTRINMFIRKISNEFYDNHKQNLYMNIEIESFDEDNYNVANSNSYEIDKISNSVVMKIIIGGPNMKLVQVSAKLCKVSVNELRNYLNTMITKEHKDEIKEVVESILFLFLFDEKQRVQDINSDKFLIYCIDLYKKSNTTNPNILKIKEILDRWLHDLGTYKKTQRLSTINDFRRALFIFFVVTIQYSNQ